MPVIENEIQEKVISKTEFLAHVIRKVKVLRERGECLSSDDLEREVIKLPRAGQILPYFKDPGDNRWKVVLVSQYRIAVRSETLEAPGGIFDKGEAPEEALARELKEETGIKVGSNTIQIVLYENPLISLLDSALFGGIVKVGSKSAKSGKKSGLDTETEWTRVEVLDLVSLLKKPEKIMDMMTARLLNEVAKETGLLTKNY